MRRRQLGGKAAEGRSEQPPSSGCARIDTRVGEPTATLLWRSRPPQLGGEALFAAPLAAEELWYRRERTVGYAY